MLVHTGCSEVCRRTLPLNSWCSPELSPDVRLLLMCRPTCEQSQQRTQHYWGFHKSVNFFTFGDFSRCVCICSTFAWPRPCMLNHEWATVATHVDVGDAHHRVQCERPTSSSSRKPKLNPKPQFFRRVRPCSSVNENLGTVTTLKCHFDVTLAWATDAVCLWIAYALCSSMM